MGIDGLNKFIESTIPQTQGVKTISCNALQDKALAVDISIYLYQYSCAIKSSVNEIVNQDGKIITHIQGILSKALGMIKKKIKPIFIFDGKPPDFKQKVLDDRNNRKKKANKSVKNLNKQIFDLQSKIQESPETPEEIEFHINTIKELKDLNTEKIKSLKQTTTITREQMKECKELLNILGIPIIESIGEADSQCAYMVKNNLAYAVASEDMDILTFGAKKLIRKLSAKNECTLYDLDIILKDMDITYEQFVDICILLGSDYTTTIPGIGSKKIYKIIKTYGSIDNFISKDPNVLSGKIVIPTNFDYIKARQGFFEPEIKPITNVSWKKPDYEKLNELLSEKYSYSQDEIGRLRNVLNGGYYSVISGEKSMNQYRQGCKEYSKAKKATMSMDSDDD